VNTSSTDVLGGGGIGACLTCGDTACRDSSRVPFMGVAADALL
jgi:hypothetical protein